MKVRALRQAIHDMDDDADLFFLSDDGQEMMIDAGIHLPDFNAFYFGETGQGLLEALDDIEALTDDEVEARRVFDEEEGVECGAPEGGMCSIPEPPEAFAEEFDYGEL